ncbi:unnamed protein product [Paramecium octaurelia]|uniref:Uncharacterized protein n=1 Tax=Paramecium octaurelia TaxID=43137 RepID=A0A8S1TYN6_PAROT|nr:unnamed protein product [Paramecium octaurelia]
MLRDVFQKPLLMLLRLSKALIIMTVNLNNILTTDSRLKNNVYLNLYHMNIIVQNFSYVVGQTFNKFIHPMMMNSQFNLQDDCQFLTSPINSTKFLRILIIYKISSINQSIITTYSNTFPAKSEVFDIISDIKLWHYILIKKLQNSIWFQLFLQMLQQRRIEIKFLQYDRMQFKLSYGNLLQSYSNYLAISFLIQGRETSSLRLNLMHKVSQLLGSNFLIVQILMNNLQVANQL